MNLPKLGPLHERLRTLIGTWEGEEEVAPSPFGPGGPARGRCTFRIDVGGFYLLQDYVEERGGQEAFRGHGVFGVDPAEGSVLYFWFDSLGFPPLEPARGGWEGETLTVTKTTPRGQGRYRFRLEGGRYHYLAESKLTGQAEFLTLVRGSYRRVG